MKKFLLCSMVSLILGGSLSADPTTVAKPYEPNDWRIAVSKAYTEKVPKLGTVQVVFLGDSITHGWFMPWVKDTGTNVWKEEFKDISKYNLGMSGDKIEHVLWRITEGKQLDGFTAKLVILMIGANNLDKNTNEEIADGIKNLISVIQEKQPHAKILLLGMLPVEWKLNRHTEINKLLTELQDDMTVFYLDLSPEFMTENGKTRNLRDGIHPNEEGYRVIAKILIPEIKKLTE